MLGVFGWAWLLSVTQEVVLEALKEDALQTPVEIVANMAMHPESYPKSSASTSAKFHYILRFTPIFVNHLFCMPEAISSQRNHKNV